MKMMLLCSVKAVRGNRQAYRTKSTLRFTLEFQLLIILFIINSIHLQLQLSGPSTKLLLTSPICTEHLFSTHHFHFFILQMFTYLNYARQSLFSLPLFVFVSLHHLKYSCKIASPPWAWFRHRFMKGVCPPHCLQVLACI